MKPCHKFHSSLKRILRNYRSYMTFTSNFLKMFKQMLSRYHENQVASFLDFIVGHRPFYTSFLKLIFQTLFFEQAVPVKCIAQCSVRAFSLFFVCWNGYFGGSLVQFLTCFYIVSEYSVADSCFSAVADTRCYVLICSISLLLKEFLNVHKNQNKNLRKKLYINAY